VIFFSTIETKSGDGNGVGVFGFNFKDDDNEDVPKSIGLLKSIGFLWDKSVLRLGIFIGNDDNEDDNNDDGDFRELLVLIVLFACFIFSHSFVITFFLLPLGQRTRFISDFFWHSPVFLFFRVPFIQR
jgi:hypothetical protein